MREYFPLEGYSREMTLNEFQKKKIELNESSMIEILQNESSSKYWKWNAAIALREFGTEKCIPILKKMVEYPNEDVKNSAILTIAHIAGEVELEFLLSLLDRKKLKKGYVLWAVCAVNDMKALQPIVKYLAQKLKEDNRPNSSKNSDVDYGLIFIDRYQDTDKSVVEILEGYSKLWNKFDSFVQQELRNKTKYFKAR
jgi:hypothetical protein